MRIRESVPIRIAMASFALSTGLLNPNHFLAVAVQYLYTHRPKWSASAGIGKTLVSSGIIDRVAASLRRKRWSKFRLGLNGSFRDCSTDRSGLAVKRARARSFLRRDGTVWSTDKDGILLDLLAAEITACTEQDPGEHFAAIAEKFGTPYYTKR